MGRQKAGPVLDPVADLALRRDREVEPPDDYPKQIAQVLAWLHNAFPEGHAFAFKPLLPSVPTVPQPWLLGATAGSAELAAHFGIGYAFAGFIKPAEAAAALRAYRARFAPTPFGEGAPRCILAVNVTAAPSAEEARGLVWSARAYYARLARQGARAVVPTPVEAASELSEEERLEPTRIVAGRWPRFVAGDPQQVRATLDEMLAESGADELMVQDLAPDPAARRRSHRLLAQACGLAAG
jgi:luciferase family oxidoreductase group 1